MDTSGQPVSWGMTDLGLYGATRGIAHGVFAYEMFAGDASSGQGNVGAAVAGSLIEGVGGYLWARGAGLPAGSTTAIGALGDFGLLEGVGVAELANFFDEENDAAAAGTMLAGSALGLAGGAMLAGRRDYSYGDARIMRDGMLLGSGLTLMVADWFNPSDRTYVTAAMIGGVVGLVGGDRLVRDTEFTPGQSWLVSLGMVAGGAIGLGGGWLATQNSSDNGTALLTAGVLGATLGYGGIYAANLNSARARRVGGSSWRFEFSPLALVAARTAGPRGGAAAELPLVRAGFRF